MSFLLQSPSQEPRRVEEKDFFSPLQYKKKITLNGKGLETKNYKL